MIEVKWYFMQCRECSFRVPFMSEYPIEEPGPSEWSPDDESMNIMRRHMVTHGKDSEAAILVRSAIIKYGINSAGVNLDTTEEVSG
jgi:hypothetical protein